VIEPTDEMIAAFEREGTGGWGDITDTRAGLAAVLAVVERDLTVWVTFDRDEASVLAVSASSDAGKRAAQTDSDDRTLRWEERRDGRFVDTGWVYEVRPFKLGGAQ